MVGELDVILVGRMAESDTLVSSRAQKRSPRLKGLTRDAQEATDALRSA
jgi:hypothetical protein